MEFIVFLVLLVLGFIGVHLILEVVGALCILRELDRQGYALSPERQVFYFVALIVFPTVMLCLSMSLFSSMWQMERAGGWLGVVHSWYAGATILPIWLVCQISLGRGIANPQYMLRSKVNFVMIATLAAICLWYTFSALTFRKTGWELAAGLFFSLIPGLPFLNLVLLLLLILKRGQLTGKLGNAFGVFWWVGIFGTLLAKYYASRTLAEGVPPSCFVATAAARGHRRFVGSWQDPLSLEAQTEQLRRLRAFEARLRKNVPRFHRRLRRVYNIIGPLLAARIRSPWAADVAYVFLKPLEIAASCYCRLATGTPGTGTSRADP